MISRQRLRTILRLALPITGGMVTVNILSLVDAAMVGRLGDEALAAVGLGSLAFTFTTAVLLGLGAAVQALTARRLGEGSHNELCLPLHAALVLCLLVGPLLVAPVIGYAGDLFPLLLNDPAVTVMGVPYFRAVLMAAPAMAMNYAFRGFWNGLGKPVYYMGTLIVMVAVNIVLNLALIFGKFGAPQLGVMGAGIASTISVYLGTLIYLGLAWRKAVGFARVWPGRDQIHTLLRLALPTGLQQILSVAGYLVFFKIVALVGTAEVAATTVIFRVAMVAVLPAIGLGYAAATLVGQALGRGERADADRWGREALLLCLILLTLLGLPMLLAPAWVMSLFINDTVTINLAVPALRLVGLTIGLNGTGPVLMHLLLGSGDNRRVMIIGVALQWLVALPAVWVVGPLLGFGLTAIWLAQIGYSSLLAWCYWQRWRGGGWQTLRV